MSKSIATSPASMSDAALRSALLKLQSPLSDVCLNSAGLAIGTGSKKKVKVVNDTYAFMSGVLAVEAAATEVALSGTVTNAAFNVFVLTINSSGVVSATMGTEGASLGAVVMPSVPTDEAVVGFVIINPTGTGNFVGGTTDLDDGTVVPNAVYINTPFPLNPAVVSL